MADPASGIDARAPWVMLPEFILTGSAAARSRVHPRHPHRPRQSQTGDWDRDLFRSSISPIDAAPPIVPPAPSSASSPGPLAQLDAFRNTQLIAPACHDTASAIAGIPPASTPPSTSPPEPGRSSARHQPPVTVTTPKPSTPATPTSAQPPATCCFHSLINGMWVLKQCMDAWAAEGRPWNIEDLIQQAAASPIPRPLDMDAEPLLLDSDMPERINSELGASATPHPDIAGNEPVFARLIFESLAARYASALTSLEQMLGRKLTAFTSSAAPAATSCSPNSPSSAPAFPSKSATPKAPPSATSPSS
jgi:rhamnulokinase